MWQGLAQGREDARHAVNCGAREPCLDEKGIASPAAPSGASCVACVSGRECCALVSWKGLFLDFRHEWTEGLVFFALAVAAEMRP